MREKNNNYQSKIDSILTATKSSRSGVVSTIDNLLNLKKEIDQKIKGIQKINYIKYSDINFLNPKPTDSKIQKKLDKRADDIAKLEGINNKIYSIIIQLQKAIKTKDTLDYMFQN